MLTKEGAELATKALAAELKRLQQKAAKAEKREQDIIEAPGKLIEMRKSAVELFDRIRIPKDHGDYDQRVAELDSLCAKESKLCRLVKADLVKAMDATHDARRKVYHLERAMETMAFYLRGER